MKKWLMLTVSILAMNCSVMPATMAEYKELMDIILHDDGLSFKKFLDKNPEFKAKNGELLTISPENDTTPIVFMINRGATNCLRYALHRKFIQVNQPYKYLGGLTPVEFAKEQASNNKHARKSFDFLVKHQSSSEKNSPTLTPKQATLQIQLSLVHIIDNDAAQEIDIIASMHPDFDWKAKMTGFVDGIKLPNMTPLAYAKSKKSMSCFNAIKSHLDKSREISKRPVSTAVVDRSSKVLGRPVSTARRSDELREKFAYNS